MESAGCLWASLTSQRVAANAGSKLRTKGKSGVEKDPGQYGTGRERSVQDLLGIKERWEDAGK